jgi:hypothetical protein
MSSELGVRISLARILFARFNGLQLLNEKRKYKKSRFTDITAVMKRVQASI